MTASSRGRRRHLADVTNRHRRRPADVAQPWHRDSAAALSNHGAGRVGGQPLELATAYRTIASGIVAKPHLIQRIVSNGRDDARVAARGSPSPMTDAALVLIQEGLRGVVRIPGGTAHALDSKLFPSR